MGFNWGVDVSVVYGQKLRMPTHMGRVAKRLAHHRSSDTLFKAAAKALNGVDDVPETMRKRVSRERLPTVDYSVIQATQPQAPEVGVEAIEDDPAYAWSDYPSDLSEDEEDLLVRIRKEAHGVHDPDGDSDILYNDGPELLDEAFRRAAITVLGEEHGFALSLRHGGARGEADKEAEDHVLYMQYEDYAVTADGDMDADRGGANIPWGCSFLEIPSLDADAKREVDGEIKRLVEELGFEPVSAIGWHLVTVADGG